METGTDNIIHKLLDKTEQQGDCLIWKGRLQGGVPFRTIRCGKGKTVHITVRRFFYERRTGETLHRQAKLSMSCGNPLCVNPDHIVLGSGIGTGTGKRQSEVLRAYEDLRQATIMPKPLSWYASQIGVSYPTLKRYVNEYAENPTHWRGMWEAV